MTQPDKTARPSTKALDERECGHFALERFCDGCFEGMVKHIASLKAEIKRLREENESYKTTFDLQHKRTVAADKLWQKAFNKPGVLPDLGELIRWLLERTDQAESRLGLAMEVVEAARKLIYDVVPRDSYCGICGWNYQNTGSHRPDCMGDEIISSLARLDAEIGKRGTV